MISSVYCKKIIDYFAISSHEVSLIEHNIRERKLVRFLITDLIVKSHKNTQICTINDRSIFEYSMMHFLTN